MTCIELFALYFLQIANISSTAYIRFQFKIKVWKSDWSVIFFFVWKYFLKAISFTKRYDLWDNAHYCLRSRLIEPFSDMKIGRSKERESLFIFSFNTWIFTSSHVKDFFFILLVRIFCLLLILTSRFLSFRLSFLLVCSFQDEVGRKKVWASLSKYWLIYERLRNVIRPLYPKALGFPQSKFHFSSVLLLLTLLHILYRVTEFKRTSLGKSGTASRGDILLLLRFCLFKMPLYRFALDLVFSPGVWIA